MFVLCGKPKEVFGKCIADTDNYSPMLSSQGWLRGTVFPQILYSSFLGTNVCIETLFLTQPKTHTTRAQASVCVCIDCSSMSSPANLNESEVLAGGICWILFKQAAKKNNSFKKEPTCSCPLRTRNQPIDPFSISIWRGSHVNNKFSDVM